METAGIDVIWVAEAYGFDGVSMLGYLAAKTERAQLGSGILNIYSRTPALLGMTAAGLDFLPLTWERFDLVLRQRDYFLPGPQKLFAFCRSSVMRERAAELGGYDIGVMGEVRLIN